jgi:hypothetical protein
VSGIGDTLGDSHAGQNHGGQNNAGYFVCCLCVASVLCFLNITLCVVQTPRSLEASRVALAMGSPEDVPGLNEFGPGAFLGEFHTPLDERSLGESRILVDFPLHDRTGVIKLLLLWAIVNSYFNARQRALLNQNFCDRLNKGGGFLQYMDGGNYLRFALFWDEIMLPVLYVYRIEFALMRHYIMEIILLTEVQYQSNRGRT